MNLGYTVLQLSLFAHSLVVGSFSRRKWKVIKKKRHVREQKQLTEFPLFLALINYGKIII